MIIRAIFTAFCIAFGIACAPHVAHTQFSFGDDERASHPGTGDQLILNYVKFDEARFASHLVITDHEGSGAVVDVLIYDRDGQLMDEQSFFLPIFGKVNYDPVTRLAGKVFIGSIRIYSDGGNVSAQYWHFHRDPTHSVYNTAIPAMNSAGSAALLCQHFVAAPNIDARLVLVNPSSDSSLSVAVTFYLDRGKQLSRDKHVIAPNGMITLDPYTENEGLIRTGIAYCEVVDHGVITGEYWQASKSERYQVSLPMQSIPVREKHW